MTARSFNTFRYDTYIGDSRNNGHIWRYDEDLTDDDGTAIEPYIQTGDWILGSRTRDIAFYKLWTYFNPSTVYDEATIEYYVNKDTSSYKDYTVDLTANSDYEDMFIKHQANGTPDRIRTINFKIKDFEQFYGLDFIYKVQQMGYR